MRKRAILSLMMSLGAAGSLVGACSEEPQSAQSSNVTENATCRAPRVLFVVDASSSMLAELPASAGAAAAGGSGGSGGAGGAAEAPAGQSKWDALGNAVESVLGTHGDHAQFGLMTFPGEASGCAAGDVQVDIGVLTGDTINGAIAGLDIPKDSATPAGQTLMAASELPQLLDPNYENYVVFISDGWQYCTVDGDGAPGCVAPGDADAMGMSKEPSCNSCQINDSRTACDGQTGDGCYCVRSWPVRGVEALKEAGIATYVVGFGDKVDARTLNRAAAAGGEALPNCDPDSESASCYLKATSTGELSDVLGKIMHRLTRTPCEGGCGIEGQRRCTLNGWTECRAPKEVSCNASCGEGKKTCEDGQLSECEASCGAGGSGGTGGAPAAGGSDPGGSGPVGGSGGSVSAGGSVGSGGSTSAGGRGAGGRKGGEEGPEEEDPWGDDYDYDDSDYDGTYGDGGAGGKAPAAGNQDVKEEGGCAYQPGSGSGSANGGMAWVLAALGAVFSRRRRRR